MNRQIKQAVMRRARAAGTTKAKIPMAGVTPKHREDWVDELSEDNLRSFVRREAEIFDDISREITDILRTADPDAEATKRLKGIYFRHDMGPADENCEPILDDGAQETDTACETSVYSNRPRDELEKLLDSTTISAVNLLAENDRLKWRQRQARVCLGAALYWSEEKSKSLMPFARTANMFLSGQLDCVFERNIKSNSKEGQEGTGISE
jgi:hypothetical protein